MGDYGMISSSIVTLLTLALIFVLSYNAGAARSKYKVPAPKMDGPIGFMRAQRAHMNTLEWTVTFLPLLWMATGLGYGKIASVLGIIWIIARIMYAKAYYEDPAKRWTGFKLQNAMIILLAILVIWGLIDLGFGITGY